MDIRAMQDMPVATAVATTYAVILGALALVSTGVEVASFFDPCTTWGDGGASSAQGPSERCQSVGTVSETRTEAALRLVAFQGTAVGAAVLAAFGALRHDGHFLAAAAVMYGIITVPLMFSVYFLLPLIGCITCMIAAARTWPQRGAPAAPA